MSGEKAKGLSGSLLDMSEYLSQLATLAAGSIVVLATFAGEGGERGGHASAFASVGLFAYCIVATVVARFALISRSTMEPDDSDLSGTETFIAWALSTGLMAFALGVIALAVYAIQSI